jgi:aminoglycoside N3'-acetyltransferase
MQIEFQDILKIIDELKLEGNEVVFLSAGLGNFGEISQIKSVNDCYSRFTLELSRRLPSGVIIVPTYSYSFSSTFEASHFCPESTNSSLGVYSNWFLRNSAEFRSVDPMVSCAFSNNKFSHLGALKNSSYGVGSIFENLLITPHPVKILNFGLGVKWMPFIHYLDYICDSPYRYKKMFRGTIEQDGKARETLWEYHVAARHPNCAGTGEKNGRMALESGLWRSWTLGKARVHLTDYKEYFEFSLQQTKLDPWNLARGPQLSLEEIERMRRVDLSGEDNSRISNKKR